MMKVIVMTIDDDDVCNDVDNDDDDNDHDHEQMGDKS